MLHQLSLQDLSFFPLLSTQISPMGTVAFRTQERALCAGSGYTDTDN